MVGHELLLLNVVAAGQARAAVELDGGIEHPASHGGGILQVEQCLVARHERHRRGVALVAEEGGLAVDAVGNHHRLPLADALQRVAPGGIERQALDDGHRQIHLPRVGVAVAVALVEGHGVLLAVEVGDLAVLEANVVVVHGERGVLPIPDGDGEDEVAAEVPRTLQRDIAVEQSGVVSTGRGHEPQVLDKRVGHAIAPTGRQPGHEPPCGRILHVQARREQPALVQHVVSPQARLHGEVLHLRVGVLGKEAVVAHFLCVVNQNERIKVYEGARVLGVSFHGRMDIVCLRQVELVARAYLVLVILAQVAVEDEVAEVAFLVGSEPFQTVAGAQPVEGDAVDDTEALPLARADADACLVRCLEVQVARVGLPLAVLPPAVPHLASLALVEGEAHVEPALHASVLVGIEPAVVDVVVVHLRHVHEAVVVGIHTAVPAFGHGGLRGVEEEAGEQLRRELVLQHGVHLVVQVGVGVEVDVDGLSLVGLAVVEVDLAGDALVAVDHGARALRDADAVEPRGRGVVPAEGIAQQAQRGDVLGHRLRVEAREAEHLYLARAGDGIAVGSLGGGGVLERRRERAAGHLRQAHAVDGLKLSERRPILQHALLRGRHGDLLQADLSGGIS